MKGTRHGSATVELPSDREVLVTRQFDAPAKLVFDVLTKPEHVRVWFGAKELEVCEIDFRVGGKYHFVGFVMDGDTATCSFRGTYLEIERPARLVGTWVFDGRPEAEAIETVELCGGDVFYLGYWMRQSGLADVLPSLRDGLGGCERREHGAGPRHRGVLRRLGAALRSRSPEAITR
ncbi:MAG: SRPBCC domain-containing protein [Trebonia sp.]